MPKLDGIEATRQMKRFYPAIPVLILSAYDNDEFVFSLLEAGTAGIPVITIIYFALAGEYNASRIGTVASS